MSESQPGQPSARPAPDASADAPPAQAAAPFALSQEPVTAQGPVPARPAGTVPAPAYEHLGELPASYGTQSVYLVAYDPHQLFAYWDIDWKNAPATPYSLHICRADGELEKRVDITPADAGRYVDVKLPGATYFVELGHHGRNGAWQPVAFSSRVTMPPPGLSDDFEPKFATLPFHLSFQRLVELIDHAMGREETLTDALSRLQQGGAAEMSPLLSTLDRLSDDQRHTLEIVLGQRFEIASDTGGHAGPGGAAQMLRDQSEALSSGGFGSEGLSSGGFGSEALSLLETPGPSSEAWRLAGRIGPGGGSDTMDSERAAKFQHAVEKNLDVLGSLFGSFGSSQGGASDGFSAGGW